MDIKSCILILLITLFLLLISPFAEGENRKTFRNSTSSVQPAGTLKTIHTDYGEVIDCVDIYKQPAFDHPLLKNHKIQEPSSYPDGARLDREIGMPRQSWQNFGKCPTGSIPILRSMGNSHREPEIEVEDDGDESSPPGGRSASGTVHASARIYGGWMTAIQQAHATFSIWKPRVGRSGDFSDAYLVILNRPGPEAMRIGWRVTGPGGPPRLFVSWNNDQGGCSNLNCPGFIQTNPNFVLNGELAASTTATQQILPIHYWRNGRGGAHRFYIGGDELGYWPLALFRRSLNHVQWSGRVYRRTAGGVVEMGNGRLPRATASLGWSAYISQVWYRNGLLPPNQRPKQRDIGWIIDMPNCYNSILHTHGNEDFFLYGGPGCTTAADNMSQFNSFSPSLLPLATSKIESG